MSFNGMQIEMQEVKGDLYLAVDTKIGLIDDKDNAKSV